MSVLERLPADVVELSPLARVALEGELDPGLASVPQRVDDLEPPPDAFEPAEREALARALEASLAPLEPHVAVLDAVRALRTPGACAVVTGQQPGFLASPLYSLYKALQAVRLARLLAQRWERPVAALFWNHADDHDVAEVHHTHVVNQNLDLQKITLPGLASGRTPFSDVVLDEEAQRLPALRAALAEVHRGAPRLDRALDVFFPRAGESLARAFTRSMTALCGPLGLVVVEPPAIRRECSAALARLVALDPAPALERGAGRVRARGFAPAIVPAEAALVFRHVPERGKPARRALRPGGEGFRYDGESGSRTPSELAAEIVQAPLEWSPGALLRPLVQDLCLPVAAYVGGYGELAYHAELGALREEARLHATPFVPRASCTLVDRETRFALERLELGVAAFLRARGEVAAGDGEAPPVVADLRAVAERAARELLALRGAVAELDPSLAVQVKRGADQVRSLVDKVAEKAERVHQNQAGKGRRHERRAQNNLFPRGEPQERVLGPFSFVARFGEAWVEELAGAIDPLGRDHLVVSLDDGEAGPRDEGASAADSPAGHEG